LSQFRLLFGNAWRRFSRMDGLARNSDPRTALVLAAIALGTPGAFLAIFLSFPIVIGNKLKMIDARPVLNDLVLCSGLLVALAALLEWDALLPDATDGAVLGPLPVPPRRLLAAHGAALGALLAVLTLIVNASSVAMMPVIDWTGASPLAGAAHQAAAVLITATLGFGSVIVLRSLAQSCAGVPGLRRCGEVMQLTGLVAVISGLLLLTGLSDPVPGRGLRFYKSPFVLAPWATGIAIAAVVSFLFTARRAFRQNTNLRRRRQGSRSPARWRRSGPRAAVSRFAALTLTRCRRQRMVVGAWFALGAGVVMAAGFSLVVRRHGNHAPTFDETVQVFISVPLVLAFFVLAGLRNSFLIPVELRANWVFRLCIGGEGDLNASARRLMGEYLAVLLLLAGTFGLWYGSATAALAQVALLAAAGALWIQALTWNLHKIPFTCSYQPGGTNLNYFRPIIGLVFTITAFFIAGWAQWLLADPWRLGVALSAALAALAGSEWHRRRRPTSDYIFDDDPEPVVQTLLAE